MTSKKETVQLDSVLKDAPSVPEPPMQCDVPEGWAAYRQFDGDCWWQRLKAWERQSGLVALPLKYVYDEKRNVIDAPEPPKVEEKENGTSD